MAPALPASNRRSKSRGRRLLPHILYHGAGRLGCPSGGTNGSLRYVVQSSWADHDMMIERLRQAFALAEQRSEQEQQMLADLLLAEMQAEEQWEALFADPRSDTLLERMVA